MTRVWGAQGQAGREVHKRVRMVAQPASVPAARTFVATTLTSWGRESMVEDISLCVSELSTNATLHSGSRFFEVELHRAAGAVRVAVLDTGSTRADALAVKSEYGDLLIDAQTADDAATTGRGIFIVSALADNWGIDELAEGKRVWAEFTQEDPAYDARSPEITRREEPVASDLVDPDDWVVVRFLDCPAAVLLAHDDHLAETIRELQLIGTDLDRPEYQRLAGMMAGHIQRHQVNWDPARIMAHEAIRAGHELADISVLAPRNVMDDVRRLRAMIAETEALSAAGKLMTLPASPEVQRIRDWFESEFRRQAEQGLDPVSYPDWAAGRVS